MEPIWSDYPVCPRCRSVDTARVSNDLDDVSRTSAAGTNKIRLLPKGHPADFYCNSCRHYFDSWGQTVDCGGLLVTVSRPETRFGEASAIFVRVENRGSTPVHWDPEQLHALGHDGTEYPLEKDDEDEKHEEVKVPAFSGGVWTDWGDTRPEPPLSIDRACDLRRRTPVHGYLDFETPEEHEVKKVVYGPVDAPLVAWVS